jgi:hypothetical protein
MLVCSKYTYTYTYTYWPTPVLAAVLVLEEAASYADVIQPCIA